MSLLEFIGHVDRELTYRDSLVIDGDMFRRFIRWSDVRWNRVVAHQVAWIIVEARRHYVASSEAFLNMENRKEMQVYVICATSKAAHQRALADLRARVETESGGKITRTAEYLHPHLGQTTGPSPLVEPE
jgi:hypothetical protein